MTMERIRKINDDKDFWREERVKRIAAEEHKLRYRNKLRAIEEEKEATERKLRALKEYDKALALKKIIVLEEEEKKRQILSHLNRLNIIS